MFKVGDANQFHFQYSNYFLSYLYIYIYIYIIYIYIYIIKYGSTSVIVGIAMKICGFRIFRTFKNHLTIGFSRKYLLKRIGTAVIMLHLC